MDATLNWFLRSEDEKIKGYVTNSERKGWYEDNSGGSKKPTGTPIGNNENEVNKIWDMAGNVWEWTIEVYGTQFCDFRGGCCYNSGSYLWHPVSRRIDSDFYPHESDSVTGSRSALYINK